jgi:shikimate dehydrogenase
MTAPKACVIGWPIKHSRSPLIHRYWLKHYGIDGDYVKEPVEPQNLREFVSNLTRHGYVGCNVTMPHKEQAFLFVTPADELTAKLAASNTIFIRDGKTFGTNTDGEGFLQNLLSHVPGFTTRNKHFTVLGAGGSARAIAAKLMEQGAAEIAVINRSPERTAQLRNDFGSKIVPVDWRHRQDVLAETDVLINTTPLGMNNAPGPDLDLARLSPQAIVTDIIYTPLETSLLRDAKARGNRTVPGLGMLLHQAVRGFELWFGRRPEVTEELYTLIAADIEKPQ